MGLCSCILGLNWQCLLIASRPQSAFGRRGVNGMARNVARVYLIVCQRIEVDVCMTDMFVHIHFDMSVLSSILNRKYFFDSCCHAHSSLINVFIAFHLLWKFIQVKFLLLGPIQPENVYSHSYSIYNI
jgi:hypothetical protein